MKKVDSSEFSDVRVISAVAARSRTTDTSLSRVEAKIIPAWLNGFSSVFVAWS